MLKDVELRIANDNQLMELHKILEENKFSLIGGQS